MCQYNFIQSIVKKDIKYNPEYYIIFNMNFVISNKDKKELFVSLFQVLKSCSTLIHCTFEPAYLHIQGMDKSHVCLYDVKITKEWFDVYEIEDTKMLCFDSNVFHSIITTKSDNQDLIVKMLPDSEDTLHIHFINKVVICDVKIDEVKEDDAKGKNTKKEKKPKKEKQTKVIEKNEFKKLFKMPLAEYDYEEMVIPSVDYDAEFTFSSKLAADIFGELSNFGTDIMFKCSEDSIHLNTNSVTGEMCVQIPIDDLSSYSIVEGEEVELNYSLVYLNKMCITSKISNEIEFCLSNNCPMKISYNLGEGSTIIFYMGPKST